LVELKWEHRQTHGRISHAYLPVAQFSIFIMRASWKFVRPVVLFHCENYCSNMQIYRDLATSVWAAITWHAFSLHKEEGVQKQKLWAVDHSARISRKSKANFVIYCELQNALIINLSNAHCGYWLTVAPFVWGSVVTSIVTFVSGGLWSVMVLMSCVESCVWRFIKVSLLLQTRSMG
jgi:hypothetical protein